VLKRHDNTIYKLSLRSKKTIKATPSSMTRIGLIVYIEDSKEASGVDHIHIKENTKVKEITRADIITITYPIRSDAISAINLNTSQASIQ
jgi:hypothetical protein